MAQPNIQLIYFNFGGRAEAIRLILTAGNVPFEDVRLSEQEFGQRKAAGEFKFGQVPVVVIDGKQYAQSSAIQTYAGQLGGLYPSDPLLALRVNEARALLDDLSGHLRPSIQEHDQAKKLALRKEFVEKQIPAHYGPAEKLIQENGSEFFVGTSPTVADIVWYVHFSQIVRGVLDGIPASVLDNYPHLKKNYETIANHPQIKAWNDAHQPK